VIVDIAKILAKIHIHDCARLCPWRTWKWRSRTLSVEAWCF
jgi:hypothetical protein